MKAIIKRIKGLNPIILMTLIVGISLMSMKSIITDGWVAPPEADKFKNPLVCDEETIKEGKKTYVKLCNICHGDKGKGDGIAGTSLNPSPSNLMAEGVQKQTDGAIYWKITEGKPPMASYKLALTDEQRWQLVNYIRELGKTSKK